MADLEGEPSPNRQPYRAVRDSHEGYLPMSNGESNYYGIADLFGKLIIAPMFARIPLPSNGYIWAKCKGNRGLFRLDETALLV